MTSIFDAFILKNTDFLQHNPLKAFTINCDILGYLYFSQDSEKLQVLFSVTQNCTANLKSQDISMI